MNPIRQTYCRTYQKIFKMAIPMLPYRKPRMLHNFRQLPPVFRKHDVDSVLIVTDPGIRRLGLLAPLQRALKKAGIAYAIFDQVVANPTTENVEDALRLYRKEGCAAIIGFGGGSSMDCAKALGIRVARPHTPLRRMEGVLRVMKQLPLIVAVPTTAGTGSETTLAAVLVDSDTRHKFAINDFPLIPQYAVLDPVVTMSLPPHITASTGLDALTHAVEAYIGNSTTRETRQDARKAVRLIFDNLDLAYRDGRNLSARRNMLAGSFFAGCAFTVSYVGYCHAVAHSLGGEYNTPHGLANAVLLPHVLRAYGPCIDRKLWELAIVAGLADKNTPYDVAAERFITEIEAMKQRFGIGDTFPELRRKDIRRLARYADREANPQYPVPRIMDAEELEVLYYMVLEKGN